MDMDENEPVFGGGASKNDDLANLVALDSFSVEDLQQRIEQLRAEIKRCEAALEGKRADFVAAEALFSSKG